MIRLWSFAVWTSGGCVKEVIKEAFRALRPAHGAARRRDRVAGAMRTLVSGGILVASTGYITDTERRTASGTTYRGTMQSGVELADGGQSGRRRTDLTVE